MKPRTILQRRVHDLSFRIPNIPKSFQEWGEFKSIGHFGYATKNRVVCMDCGNLFSPSLVSRKRATCPHCETKLTIQVTKKTTLKQESIFAVAEIVEEFQVIRHFLVRTSHKMGRAAKVFSTGVIEIWVTPDGKFEFIGNNRTTGWYSDSWNGGWEIRNKNHEDKFDIVPDLWHPKSVFKPEYLKYGIDYRLKTIGFLEAIKLVPNCSKAETLIKARRYDLLFRPRSLSEDLCYRHWPTIKIALRNNYRPKDVGIWFDYLNMLWFFNKDLRNAVYVCPKNLKKEHDRYVKKKRQYERRMDELKRRNRIESAQESYGQRIKQFSGIIFSDGKITIKVLEHVKEFEIEGDTLNHCVFTSEYYEREDSLIFSARINDEPIETIEFSLTEMVVMQSRGYHNEPSDYHHQILKLFTKNISKIAARMEREASVA